MEERMFWVSTSMNCPDLAEQLRHALRMSGRRSEDAATMASTSGAKETQLELLCPEVMTKEALIVHLRNVNAHFFS